MLNSDMLDAVAVLGGAAAFGGLVRAYIRHRMLVRILRVRGAEATSLVRSGSGTS